MTRLPREYCPLRIYGFCSHFLFILDNGSRDKVTGYNWIDLIGRFK